MPQPAVAEGRGGHTPSPIFLRDHRGGRPPGELFQLGQRQRHGDQAGERRLRGHLELGRVGGRGCESLHVHAYGRADGPLVVVVMVVVVVVVVVVSVLRPTVIVPLRRHLTVPERRKTTREPSWNTKRIPCLAVTDWSTGSVYSKSSLVATVNDTDSVACTTVPASIEAAFSLSMAIIASAPSFSTPS